jgi:hypothetical protein
MAKKVTEHDALKGVDQLLESLSAEERQRILDWVAMKYKLSNSGASTLAPPPPQHTANGSQGGNSNNVKVKDFIAAKKPDGYYERIACLAYYLEKYEDKDGLKTADIAQANTDAKQSKLPNSTLYVNNATKMYGFLISIGKGKKALSARGEAVVNALPDRAKVQTALTEHPLKRKNSKKKKKTKA